MFSHPTWAVGRLAANQLPESTKSMAKLLYYHLEVSPFMYTHYPSKMVMSPCSSLLFLAPNFSRRRRRSNPVRLPAELHRHRLPAHGQQVQDGPGRLRQGAKGTQRWVRERDREGGSKLSSVFGLRPPKCATKLSDIQPGFQEVMRRFGFISVIHQNTLVGGTSINYIRTRELCGNGS